MVIISQIPKLKFTGNFPPLCKPLVLHIEPLSKWVNVTTCDLSYQSVEEFVLCLSIDMVQRPRRIAEWYDKSLHCSCWRMKGVSPCRLNVCAPPPSIHLKLFSILLISADVCPFSYIWSTWKWCPFCTTPVQRPLKSYKGILCVFVCTSFAHIAEFVHSILLKPCTLCYKIIQLTC